MFSAAVFLTLRESTSGIISARRQFERVSERIYGKNITKTRFVGKSDRSKKYGGGYRLHNPCFVRLAMIPIVVIGQSAKRVAVKSWLLGSLAAATAMSACSEQPKREVSAVVVDIRPHASPKWNTDQLVVEARDADGLVGTKEVLPVGLTCRVGDRVRATAQGISLTLDVHACVRAGTPPLRTMPL